jgi:hypothetical protein
LAELLAESGYATAALTDGILMTPEYGMDQGFDRFVARYEPLRAKLADAHATIRDLAGDGAPYFLFVHSYAVHEPYSVPSDGKQQERFFDRARGGMPLGVRSTFDMSHLLEGEMQDRLPATRIWMEALYDAASHRTDMALVEFLERIEAEGLLDDTVVVVTADHGEELFDRGAIGHGFQLPRRELVHVPLIVRAPRQKVGMRFSEPIAQPAIPNLLLTAIGIDARLGPDACVVPGVAGSFVTNPSYARHPLDRFVSLAVYSDACMDLSVTPHAGGDPVLRETELFGTQEACELRRPQMETVASCLRSRILEGAPREAPSAPALDAQQLKQMRALGYVR